jgi:hypothetical protein
MFERIRRVDFRASMVDALRFTQLSSRYIRFSHGPGFVILVARNRARILVAWVRDVKRFVKES